MSDVGIQLRSTVEKASTEVRRMLRPVSLTGGGGQRQSTARRDAPWLDFICQLDELVRGNPRVIKTSYGTYVRLDPVGQGFSMQVSFEEKGCLLLSFGQWFDEFDDPKSVIRLIREALAGRVRIRTERAADKLRSCALQMNVDGRDWIEFAKLDYPSWSPFRRKVDTIYASF